MMTFGSLGKLICDDVRSMCKCHFTGAQQGWDWIDIWSSPYSGTPYPHPQYPFDIYGPLNNQVD